MSRPALIGLTLDHEQPSDHKAPGYSKFPWYALRENYASAVTHGGGAPLMLPHELTPRFMAHRRGMPAS